MINDHLRRTRGGKISFTHILGWAIVKAVQVHPDMNIRYEVQDGKPTAVQPEHINLGLAIDLPQKDGSLLIRIKRQYNNYDTGDYLD